MRVLGIIPARKGSKRLPGKNHRDFCGKPLAAWAVEAALGAKLLTRIIVSSDDDIILSIAQQYAKSGVIPLPRPSELAGDKAPAIQYVQHALTYMESQGQHFDATAIIQPSSPLTLPSDIDGTIQLLIDSGADSAVSVVKLDHAIHPIKLKILKGDKLLPFWEPENGRMAEHELPELYVRNCSVYVTNVNTLREGKIIGEDCRGYLMPPERSVDINTEIDFVFGEYLMSRILNFQHNDGN